MSRQRLYELTLLSIKKELLNKIDYDNIISNFASKKRSTNKIYIKYI